MLDNLLVERHSPVVFAGRLFLGHKILVRFLPVAVKYSNQTETSNIP